MSTYFNINKDEFDRLIIIHENNKDQPLSDVDAYSLMRKEWLKNYIPAKIMQLASVGLNIFVHDQAVKYLNNVVHLTPGAQMALGFAVPATILFTSVFFPYIHSKMGPNSFESQARHYAEQCKLIKSEEPFQQMESPAKQNNSALNSLPQANLNNPVVSNQPLQNAPPKPQIPVESSRNEKSNGAIWRPETGREIREKVVNLFSPLVLLNREQNNNSLPKTTNPQPQNPQVDQNVLDVEEQFREIEKLNNELNQLAMQLQQSQNPPERQPEIVQPQQELQIQTVNENGQNRSAEQTITEKKSKKSAPKRKAVEIEPQTPSRELRKRTKKINYKD